MKRKESMSESSGQSWGKVKWQWRQTQTEPIASDLTKISFHTSTPWGQLCAYTVVHLNGFEYTMETHFCWQEKSSGIFSRPQWNPYPKIGHDSILTAPGILSSGFRLAWHEAALFLITHASHFKDEKAFNRRGPCFPLSLLLSRQNVRAAHLPIDVKFHLQTSSSKACPDRHFGIFDFFNGLSFSYVMIWFTYFKKHIIKIRKDDRERTE